MHRYALCPVGLSTSREAAAMRSLDQASHQLKRVYIQERAILLMKRVQSGQHQRESGLCEAGD